jgi:hypothetical protein
MKKTLLSSSVIVLSLILTLLATDVGAQAYVRASRFIADGIILTSKLADSAVTAAKIATNAVVTAKIANDAVTTDKIAAASVTSAKLDEKTIRYAEATISAAQMVATTAGGFGHADGLVVVAAPGSGKAIELVSATVIYDFATAAYTTCGNVTINYAGGAALTGVVSAANSFAASGDKVVVLYPETTVGVPLLVNTGLNIVSSAACVQPGTAAGVGRVKVVYLVLTTGL